MSRVSERIFKQCNAMVNPDPPFEPYRQLKNYPGTNVALLKTATQSSNHSTGSYPASKATNGVVGHSQEFTHTDELDPSPWWEVDLGRWYVLSSIKVINRADCCKERLVGAKVVLMDADRTPGPTFELSSKVQEEEGKEEINFLDDPDWCFPTRYVKIMLDRAVPLSLQEVEVFAVDDFVPDDSTLKYGDMVSFYLQDGVDNLRKILSGGRKSYNNLVMTEPTKDEINIEGFFIKSANFGDRTREYVDPRLKGVCVRYGDKIMIQSNWGDGKRFLAQNGIPKQANTHEHRTITRVDPDLGRQEYYWQFRSSPNHEVRNGECVRHGETVYVKNYSMNIYLMGGHGAGGNDGVLSSTRNLDPTKIQQFQWEVSKVDPSEQTCVATSTRGRWVSTGFVNGAQEIEREKGVVKSDGSSYSHGESWSNSVSASVSAGFKFGSASLTVTKTRTGSREETFKKFVETEQGTTVVKPFSRPGNVWQFVIDVDDSCANSATVMPDFFVMTDSITQKPCCLPFDFVDQTNPHGPCVTDAPCDCSEAVCSGNGVDSGVIAHDPNEPNPEKGDIMYGDSVYLQVFPHRPTPIRYLTGARGFNGHTVLTKDMKQNNEESRKTTYQWIVRSHIGETGIPQDLDMNNSTCLKYGDIFWLQNKGANQRYLSIHADSSVHANTNTHSVNPHSSSGKWMIRKTRGDGLRDGSNEVNQCVKETDQFYIQNMHSDKMWLAGGVSDKEGIHGNAEVYNLDIKSGQHGYEPELAEEDNAHRYVWTMRKNYYEREEQCSITSLNGTWVPFDLAADRAGIEITETYGVTDSTEIIRGKQREFGIEVSASVSAGVGSNSVSVSATSSYGESQSWEASRAMSKITQDTYTVTFEESGILWKWIYDVEDTCNSKNWKLETRSVLITKNRDAAPCCLPGLFALPDKVHGPCLEGTPCFCDEEVCNAPIEAEPEMPCDCEDFSESSSIPNEVVLKSLCEGLWNSYKFCMTSPTTSCSSDVPVISPPSPISMVAAAVGTCKTHLGKGKFETLTTDCENMGGIAPPNSGEWTRCEVDWCDLRAGTTTGRAYSAARKGSCDEKAAYAIVYVPKHKCEEIGGVINDVHADLSYVPCHIDFCVVGNGKGSSDGESFVPGTVGSCNVHFSFGSMAMDQDLCEKLAGSNETPADMEFISNLCFFDWCRVGKVAF